MLFDTHTHIFLGELAKDMDACVSEFKENGWKYMVNVWVDIPSSKKVIDISNKYEESFATVWIHPCYVMDLEWTPEENVAKLKELYLANKDVVIWIWEAGLDNYHISKTEIEKEKSLQEKYFRLQIKLSKELNLPLIIHNREAWEKTLEILKDEKCDSFIIHCFSEDINFARECMSFSDKCVFAFGGVATYPKALEIREAAKLLPIERIVVETDAPYLAPQSYRWKTNKPHYVLEVIKEIATLRWEDYEDVKKMIFENSVSFFWV